MARRTDAIEASCAPLPTASMSFELPRPRGVLSAVKGLPTARIGMKGAPIGKGHQL